MEFYYYFQPDLLVFPRKHAKFLEFLYGQRGGRNRTFADARGGDMPLVGADEDCRAERLYKGDRETAFAAFEKAVSAARQKQRGV